MQNYHTIITPENHDEIIKKATKSVETNLKISKILNFVSTIIMLFTTFAIIYAAMHTIFADTPDMPMFVLTFFFIVPFIHNIVYMIAVKENKTNIKNARLYLKAVEQTKNGDIIAEYNKNELVSLSIITPDNKIQNIELEDE